MKPKYLLSLTSSMGIAFGAIALNAQPSQAADATFQCQVTEGIPSTIAQNETGQERSVFRWNQEVLDSLYIFTEPQQLCDSVTQKLNNYVATVDDPSTLSFKGSVIDNDSLPAVCIADAKKQCQRTLFTLRPLPNRDPLVSAQTALSQILAPELQPQTIKVGDRDRGVQRTSYEVNFWEFLGFGGF